jgi:hypothetical protein
MEAGRAVTHKNPPRKILVKLLPASNDSVACIEGAELFEAWVHASLPCIRTELEYIELHEEARVQARSALLEHRRTCAECRTHERSVLGWLIRLVAAS